MLGFSPIASQALGDVGTAQAAGGGVVTPPAPTASLIMLTGPGSGEVLAGSSAFTVSTDYPVSSPTAITPYAIGGGYFAPNSVMLTASTLTATFIYVPDSTGTKTINVLNGNGLTPPAALTYTATPSTAPAPVAATSTGAGIGSYRGWREEDWKKRQAQRDTLAEELRAAAEEVKQSKPAPPKTKKVLKRRSRYF